MPDNYTLADNSGAKKAATDEVTYSGDTADVQLVRPVLTTGDEGDKTVVALPGDAEFGLDVDVARLPGVAGTVADDSADSGNPVKVGWRAVEYTTQSAVAAGTRADGICDRHRVPFVVGGHPDAISLEYATTGAQTDTAIVTVSSGNKIVVTQAQIVADNANTAFPSVRVGLATTNTPTTTGVVISHPGVPAGGGCSRGDGSGIVAVGADGEDLRITCGAPTGGSIRVLVTYYVVPS